MNVIAELHQRIEHREKCALVMLTECSGSVPGVPGELMLVYPDGTSIGTIGGGSIEFQVIQDALEGMETGENHPFRYQLNETGDLGMICGGEVSGFIKYFRPGETLYIFGGGHCGQALAKVAKNLDFEVVVVDPRGEILAHPAYMGLKTIQSSFLDLDGLDFTDAYLVIMTPSHSHDYDVLKTVISSDFKYLGLMGSGSKVRNVQRRLREEGISEDRIQAVHMPIGLNVASGTPEEIAISIAAEMLAIRYEKTSTESLSKKYRTT